jgi:hypothetical protein
MGSKPEEKKSDCHELKVFATNGRRFQFRVEEFAAIVTNRIVLSSIVMFCTLLAVVDDSLYERVAPVAFRVVFWNVNGLLTAFLWYWLFRLASCLMRRLGIDRAIPSALMIALAISLLVVLNYALATAVLQEPQLWVHAPADIPRYVIAALVFETTMAVFILPRLQQLHSGPAGEAAQPAAEGTDEARAEPAEGGPAGRGAEGAAAGPAAFEVGGIRIVPQQLVYLKSVEHYVEVVQQDGRHLVRSSLCHLIERLPDVEGTQPHRSYWVRRDAVVGL